ncbi:Serine/threonine-protein kinase D1 [Cichlidogyrus casuarinus]|uniref:Serine/threonine-protein kinase D1 n=1 Tax=Cichlidogyrus casuarinus TaxID=1844966 RepID=A0ABD2QK37_9PLAT
MSDRLRRHFWRLGTESIIMYHHEKTNRYFKEIPLASIVSVDKAGKNAYPWSANNGSDSRSFLLNYDGDLDQMKKFGTTANNFCGNGFGARPKHVFEIRCRNDLVYYVGQLSVGEIGDSTNGTHRDAYKRRCSFMPQHSSATVNSIYNRKASAPINVIVMLDTPSEDDEQVHTTAPNYLPFESG